MKLFHVFMGTTDTNALSLFPDNSVDVLMAASILTFDKRWRSNLPLIHQKKKELYADSGMIGWIRKIKKAALDYAMNPKLVLDIQMRLDPDIIASLDIPCESDSLKTLGISVDDAIDLTIKNAEWIVNAKEFKPLCSFNRGEYMDNKDPRLNGKKIAIGIQGWTVDEYIRCLHRYWDLGFGELPPEMFMFAIGTVCRRRPPDLYEIAQELRNRIPEQYDLHCYGIANLHWLAQLREIGITSCDTSTASFAAAFYQFMDAFGQRRRLLTESKDTLMQNALFAFNMASMNYQLENWDIPVEEQLFFEKFEQGELAI